MPRMKRLALLALSLLAGFAVANAQMTKEYLAQHPEVAMGTDRLYYGDKSTPAKPPKGYKPFYISTVARHGSRYHVDTFMYDKTRRMLAEAERRGLLTDLGKQAKAIIDRAGELHGRHTGALSQIGYEQSRGIAHRTYERFKSIFAKGAVINGRSSLYPRCVLTLAAFNQGLKECEPSLDIRQRSSFGNYRTLLPNWKESYPKRYSDVYRFRGWLVKRADSISAQQRCPKSIVRFVTDPERLEREMGLNSYEFTYDIFFRINFARNFTDDYTDFLRENFDVDDLYAYAKHYSDYWLLRYGIVDVQGCALTIAALRPIVDDIVNHANSVLDGSEQVAAHLRCTHDTYLFQLLALMRVPECYCEGVDIDNLCMKTPICMAANMQFVFFRNKQGRVLVQILYNEADAKINIGGNEGPFYEWQSLCNHLYDCLSHAERTAGIK